MPSLAEALGYGDPVPVIAGTGAPTSPQALARPASAGREGVVEFWVSKGAPKHVAEGIADSVGRESGYKSTAWNPNDMGSPSGGLYQHHADRLTGLQNYAAAQGTDWHNFDLQNQYAYHDVTGGDPIASKHWQEILAAPDRATAQTLWDKYFERGAAVGPGGGGRGGRGPAGGFGGGFAGIDTTSRKKAFGLDDEDGLEDEGDRRERDRLRAQFAKFAAERAPPELELPAAPEATVAPAAAPTVEPDIQMPKVSMPTPPRAPPMPDIPIPKAPNLREAYQAAIASILQPKRNPLEQALRG